MKRQTTTPPVDQNDLPGRAAYQAFCETRGIRPNWGKNGYQANADRWRTIAAAAANPKEPPIPPKKPKRPAASPSHDLHDIAMPMSQAILVLARLMEIPDSDLSRFAGNVKNLQRNGFPKGLHTKRGNPAKLDRDQLMQLVVCETLHRAGLMPIPAMAATQESWDAIRTALISTLTDEGNDPMAMVLVIETASTRNVSVLSMDRVVDLIRTGNARSVALHRLDILAVRLKKAVNEVLSV